MDQLRRTNAIARVFSLQARECMDALKTYYGKEVRALEDRGLDVLRDILLLQKEWRAERRRPRWLRVQRVRVRTVGWRRAFVRPLDFCTKKNLKDVYTDLRWRDIAVVLSCYRFFSFAASSYLTIMAGHKELEYRSTQNSAQVWNRWIIVAKWGLWAVVPAAQVCSFLLVTWFQKKIKEAKTRGQRYGWVLGCFVWRTVLSGSSCYFSAYLASKVGYSTWRGAQFIKLLYATALFLVGLNVKEGYVAVDVGAAWLMGPLVLKLDNESGDAIDFGISASLGIFLVCLVFIVRTVLVTIGRLGKFGTEHIPFLLFLDQSWGVPSIIDDGFDIGDPDDMDNDDDDAPTSPDRYYSAPTTPGRNNAVPTSPGMHNGGNAFPMPLDTRIPPVHEDEHYELDLEIQHAVEMHPQVHPDNEQPPDYWGSSLVNFCRWLLGLDHEAGNEAPNPGA